MELAACLFEVDSSCLVPWGCNEVPWGCLRGVMGMQWGCLQSGIACLESVYCEAFGTIVGALEIRCCALEVPWRCHWGVIGASGVSWRCLESFMGWGPQRVMGVPWYTVMGYQEVLIGLSWK